MAYTAKQQRNGADVSGGGGSTPQTGPMPDVAPLMSQSVSAAMSRESDAHALWVAPQGSGVSGHTIGTNGSVTEWDSGLAINDVEGGGSG